MRFQIATRRCFHRIGHTAAWLGWALLVQFIASPAFATDTVNVYSIWPENWTKPLFDEFEKATGIKVNSVRFSSRWALARIIADKNNPPVDVLFGGSAEAFAAGIDAGIFESYKPPSFAVLHARFRQADGQWTAVAHDPLVFMTNDKFVKEKKLKAPASWNDLLALSYRNMLQMADARTSDAGVLRIFSILEVNGRNENKAFAYMKKLRPNVQLYTKNGDGGTAPVGQGDAGGGIFFMVDAWATKARRYDVTISVPKEGIGTVLEGIALIKGAKNPQLGRKLIDWATSPTMQNNFAKYNINFVPAHPDAVLESSLGEILKGGKFFPIDADYAAANRKRIVDRWVAEVLNR
jgi:iron(III) transport system substrate-binding protein